MEFMAWEDLDIYIYIYIYNLLGAVVVCEWLLAWDMPRVTSPNSAETVLYQAENPMHVSFPQASKLKGP